MSLHRLITILLAGAIGAAVLAAGGLFDGAARRGAGEVGRVVKVVDGDTIDVRLGDTVERVRYIGVDTPETKDPRKPVQCYGQRASDFNTRLVGGAAVRLVRDVEPRDRYGRLLAYVYRVHDGLFVNAELARLGYAHPLTIAPDVHFADRFAALAGDAREHGRGLWSAC
ncbi:MAG TPA: thermonuclease family protein [Solirubrobacteraceae bacterium]|jgi:micrococcal nuclease|nr:thermonuclease family protein [Solirubrobacteraceae bacterium]